VVIPVGAMVEHGGKRIYSGWNHGRNHVARRL